MTAHKLTNAWVLASTIALGGCASTVTHVNNDSCTTWDQNNLKVPLTLEFGFSSKAVSSNECKEGKRIGYAAVLGRQQNGDLHAGSLITWHKAYKDLKNRISNANEDDVKRLQQVQQFADSFIQLGSQKNGQSMVTSAMAQSMFDMKLTDPTLFAVDGTYAPAEKKSAPLICKGEGILRICAPVNDQAPQ